MRHNGRAIPLILPGRVVPASCIFGAAFFLLISSKLPLCVHPSSGTITLRYATRVSLQCILTALLLGPLLLYYGAEVLRTLFPILGWRTPALFTLDLAPFAFPSPLASTYRFTRRVVLFPAGPLNRLAWRIMFRAWR